MTSERTRPPREVFTIRSLDQLKILSDPLRVRIVEALCEERTTKQVAERIGEPPTKLYHHVEMLEKAGLVRPTRTRQNRGTLEKYYVAAARTFRADPAIFAGDDAGPEVDETLRQTVTTVLRGTEDELLGLLASRDAAREFAERGVLSLLELHADPRRIARVQREIETLLESLGDLSEDDEDAGAGTDETPTERYRLTLAFFPLPRDG